MNKFIYKHLHDKLSKLARQEAQADDEDFNAYEFSGGNFDDAYYIGTVDGRIHLARELLNLLELDDE